MNIQWLFIDGVAEGKTLWIKNGNNVFMLTGKDTRCCNYLGYDYLHNGHIYRIGVVDPYELLPSKIEALIKSTKLTPID